MNDELLDELKHDDYCYECGGDTALDGLRDWWKAESTTDFDDEPKDLRPALGPKNPVWWRAYPEPWRTRLYEAHQSDFPGRVANTLMQMQMVQAHDRLMAQLASAAKGGT